MEHQTLHLIDFARLVESPESPGHAGHVGAVVSRKAATGLWPQLSRWWAVRDTDEARGLDADDVAPMR